MSQWGWRIPLLAGCAIIPFLFLLRRSLEETPEFLARKHHPGAREILSTVASRTGALVLLGMMLSTMTTVCFYLITAYTPTFGGTVLHLEDSGVQWVILCVGASNFVWLPGDGGSVGPRGAKAGIVCLFHPDACLPRIRFWRGW